MEKQHPLSEILEASLTNLKQLVNVNTVIGDAIVLDGVTIIPVSTVHFGYASGGSQFPTDKANIPFGGGSGGGVTITPVAFLTISQGEVRVLQLQTANNTADRVVNMVPGVLDQVSNLMQKKPNSESEA